MYRFMVLPIDEQHQRFPFHVFILFGMSGLKPGLLCLPQSKHTLRHAGEEIDSSHSSDRLHVYIILRIVYITHA
jgi:hypothetical protein